MIPGDEGKPKSIMEFITDEPLEPEPYIDYVLRFYRAHREIWLGPGDVPASCVLAKCDMFIDQLEDIKRKMHRPTARNSTPNAVSSPSGTD